MGGAGDPASAAAAGSPALAAGAPEALIAADPALTALPDALRRSAERHAHLCPRQVLGARLALAGAAALGIAVPQADKRLLAIVESDGCFSDGVAAATGCAVGHRTMRVEDVGRIAATFVDTAGGVAVRVRPQRGVRERLAGWDDGAAALAAALGVAARWARYVLAYQRMPDSALLDVVEVELAVDAAALLSHPDRRAVCRACGEEVFNGREVDTADGPLCRPCADPAGAYYRPRAPRRSSRSA